MWILDQAGVPGINKKSRVVTDQAPSEAKRELCLIFKYTCKHINLTKILDGDTMAFKLKIQLVRYRIRINLPNIINKCYERGM